MSGLSLGLGSGKSGAGLVERSLCSLEIFSGDGADIDQCFAVVIGLLRMIDGGLGIDDL